MENCVGVGGVKSIDMIEESQMNICLRSILDKRRIGSSLYFRANSSLMSQTGHSVKLNGRAQLPADFVGQVHVITSRSSLQSTTNTTTTTTTKGTKTMGITMLVLAIAVVISLRSKV